ncbi:hypothetical protein BH24PSE2_BH24PSE2_23770 [soil metagenome]
MKYSSSTSGDVSFAQSHFGDTLSLHGLTLSLAADLARKSRRHSPGYGDGIFEPARLASSQPQFRAFTNTPG